MKYNVVFKFKATVKAKSEEDAKAVFIEKLHDALDYHGEEKYVTILDNEGEDSDEETNEEAE